MIDWKSIPRSAQARSTSAACAANRREIPGAGGVRVDVQLPPRFQVVEHGRRGERELDLGRVEDAQDDDLWPRDRR